MVQLARLSMMWVGENTNDSLSQPKGFVWTNPVFVFLLLCFALIQSQQRLKKEKKKEAYLI